MVGESGRFLLLTATLNAGITSLCVSIALVLEALDV